MTDEAILEMCKAERQKCENYSRVMGYYRSVDQFNDGKQSEFYERVYFKEPGCSQCEMREAV